MKSLMRQPWVQGLLARVLAGYLGFALATTRWRIEGRENLDAVREGGRAVAAFWHEILPLMPVVRPYVDPVPVTVLASRHADGQLLGGVMGRFRLGVAHGSTRRDGRERGGTAGVLALLGAVERGGIAVITPDGPRGPARVAAPGVAQLAGLSGAPLLPLAAQVCWKLRLGSWDRMVLPLPFGRGAIVCGALIQVPRDGWETSLPAITAGLNAAASRADALVER